MKPLRRYWVSSRAGLGFGAAKSCAWSCRPVDKPGLALALALAQGPRDITAGGGSGLA